MQCSQKPKTDRSDLAVEKKKTKTFCVEGTSLDFRDHIAVCAPDPMPLPDRRPTVRRSANMHSAPIRSSSALHIEGALSRRRFLQRFLRGLAALGLFFVAAGQARPDFMYWSEWGSGQIRRANPDGTEMTTLVSGQAGPSGPALDFAGGMIWGNFFSGDI